MQNGAIQLCVFGVIVAFAFQIHYIMAYTADNN